MMERLLLPPLRHPRATVFVGLALLLGAASFLPKLKLDALPDVTPNQVVVLTVAPGLTPDEVERRVTRPVEVAVAATPGLKELRSLSRYGVCSVVATFDDDMDVLQARQLVGERLSTVALPEGVERPALGPLTGGLGEVYHFMLRSPERTPAELLELTELRVAPLLQKIDGVVEVNTWGGRVRTFEATVSPSKLAAQQLTLDDVQTAIDEAVGGRAGAALVEGSQQALLRSVAYPQTPEELGDVVVHASPEAGVVHLRDVATLGEGALPRLGAASADGKGEVVYVMVQMLKGANALQVVEGIEEKMPAVREALPDDVVIDVVYSRRDIVSATLDTVGKNLLEGGLLVMAVLFLLLGSVRAGLLVALTIPASMLVAVMGMVLFDIPGNLMSLGAIDFGLLVDGAVVVTETLFHMRDDDHANDDSAFDVARAMQTVMVRVGRPVFFAVLIIALVYVPILTMSGVDGKLFRPMASTVIFALFAALVLSLTVVPAAASLVLRPQDIPSRPPAIVCWFERQYAPLLAWSMLHPKVMGAIGVLLLGVGVVAGAASGTSFVPTLDEGDLVIQTSRAPDIQLNAAVARAGNLEAALVEHVPEVQQVVSRIGSPAVATDIMGLEQADVFVRVAPKHTWRKGLTKERLIEDVQAVLDVVDPNGDPAFTQPIQMRFNEMLEGEVSDVSLSAFGPDLQVLQRYAQALAEQLRNVHGATDVRVRTPPDVKLVEVRPRLRDAALRGLTPDDVAQQVEALQKGLHVDNTWVGPLQIPLTLRLPAQRTASEVAATPIALPHGGLTRLDDVATVVERVTPSLVSREGGERRVVVGFNVRGRDLGDVAHDAEAAVAPVDRPDGVRLEWGGQAATLAAAQQRLLVVIPGVLLLILLVLVLTFAEVRPAVVVFAHVPLASVGGALALFSRGLPVSISAAVGFIALSGIAVLNGVVLMNEILRLERDGVPPDEAAAQAARSRARPVLMTALVAALGFIPMAMSSGIGAEVQRPLATVVIGGLVTSTLLTLGLLPSLYAALRSSPKDAEWVAVVEEEP